MKMIKFSFASDSIKINKNYLCFSIENKIEYRNIFYNFFNYVNIIDNDAVINSERDVLIIDNPLIFEQNDKKLINALYKKIEGIKSDESKKLIEGIEKEIRKLMDYYSLEINAPIDYLDQIDLSKILSSVNLRFKDVFDSSYIESIVSYIKAYNSTKNINYIISFGLNNVLTSQEKEILLKELETLDFFLLDFSLSCANTEYNYVVDEDCCII